MTRVVKPDELGRPDENLKEQMRKLKFSPKEGEGTLSQTSCTHQTHSLLRITHGVHCVIRSHSVNNMSANPHRRVWGCTTHACLSFLGGVKYLLLYELIHVEDVLCMRLLNNFQQCSCTCVANTVVHGKVCYHSSEATNNVKQSLQKEQMMRAEVGGQVQVLRKRGSGELLTLFYIATYS